MVSVSADTADRNPANNLVAVSREARYAADLALGAVSLPESSGFGEAVIYSLMVTNLGPHEASEVEVTGPLTDGFRVLVTQSSQGDFTNRDGGWVFRLGTLAVDATASASVTFAISRTGIVASALSVSAHEYDLNSANNLVVVTNAILPVADLEVVSVQAPDPVMIGSEVLCTIVVANLGPNIATRPFVTFPFPLGTEFISAQSGRGVCIAGDVSVTCVFDDLPVGDQATVQVRLRPLVEGPLALGASIKGREHDPEPTNNSKVLTVAAARAADLGVTLAMSKDPVPVGETFYAMLTLTNRGPEMAREGVLDVSVPDGCVVDGVETSLGIWAQASDRVHFVLTDFPANTSGTVRIGLRATRPGVMTSTATVSAREHDPNTADNSAAASSVAKWGADLAVASLHVSKVVVVGAHVVYSVVVTNRGPQEASEVLVTSPLPAASLFEDAQVSQGSVSTNQDGTVTAELGSLPVGGTAQVDIVVTPTVTGVMTNTAVVSGDFADPDLANNVGSATTQVYPFPDLVVSQVSAPNPALVQGTLVCTVNVTNRGATLAPDVMVFAAFSLNVDFNSVSVTQGDTDVVPPAILWHVGDIPPGTNVTGVFDVSPTSAGSVVWQASAFATASSPLLVSETSRSELQALDLPPLFGVRTGNRLALSWPIAANLFLLEVSEDLAGGIWLPLLQDKVIQGGSYTVTVKLSGTSRFYRLRKP